MDKENTQVKEERQSRIEYLSHKYGWIITLVCGVISLLFLLGTVVKLEFEETETTMNIHLWDYFIGAYKMDWTMYVTVGLLVLGIVFIALRKVKQMDSIASLFFILAITMLALSREFFNANYVEGADASFGWGAAVSIAFAAITAILCLSSEFIVRPITTRDIAEDGVLIAAAFILNLIKIPVASQGGSINFQMLPLFLIALRHGPAHGLVCGGIIYGLITCLTDGWGFASYPFDYLVAFGSCMIMGVFAKFIVSENQKWYNLKGLLFLLLAGILSTFIRFVGACASSVVVWKASFAFALSYNSIYVPVSGAIALLVIMVAYGPLLKVHHSFPLNK